MTRSQPISLFQFIFRILLIGFVLLDLSPTAAADNAEATLKAAFIFRLIQYVDQWPESSSAHKKLAIRVIGDEALEKALREIAAQKKINDKEMDVAALAVDSLDSMGEVGVLYFSELPNPKLAAILKVAAKKGILTMSQGKDYAKQGVHVNFYSDDGKLRFEINRKAATQSGFKFSSQLLKLARIVE